MTEAEEKAAFAALLIKNPTDPFKVALELFPDNTNRALRIAHEWPTDPEVKAAIGALKAEGVSRHSKEEIRDELITELMNIVRGPSMPDDKVKAAKAIGELFGLIEKPQTNVNVTNNIPRVVEYPVFANGDEWEQAAAQQQRELLNNARTRH